MISYFIKKTWTQLGEKNRKSIYKVINDLQTFRGKEKRKIIFNDTKHTTHSENYWSIVRYWSIAHTIIAACTFSCSTSTPSSFTWTFVKSYTSVSTGFKHVLPFPPFFAVP